MALLNSTDITFRPMRESEVYQAFQIVDKEGWNLKADKLALLFKNCPAAFFVLVKNHAHIIGTISMFPTFPGHYVVGNLVIEESFRGQGLGKLAMEKAMKSLPPASVFSLTAVPGVDHFYLKLGFQASEPPQVQIIRHIEVDYNLVDRAERSLEKDEVTVTPYIDDDFDDMKNYVNEICGYDVEPFLKMAVQCFSICIARDNRGSVVGVICSFVQRQEIVLDGVFAESDWIALVLFRETLKLHSGILLVKVQGAKCQPFLSGLGKVKDSYLYHVYSKGGPSQAKLSTSSRVYTVFDCDYTC